MALAKQELREMVIRGAHEYPGAVAVEDELGRVILLHKLPREVTSLLQRQHSLSFHMRHAHTYQRKFWACVSDVPQMGEG